MGNTVEMREISHELVLAWKAVEREHGIHYNERMQSAMDAIIAAYTPGYNAETPPDLPEEFDLNDPTGRTYSPEGKALWKAAGW